MRTVNVHEAKSTLSALLNDVEHGEEIIIVRNGTPVARLVRVALTHTRQPGLLSNDPAWQRFTYDPAIFGPLTDAELEQQGWL